MSTATNFNRHTSTRSLGTAGSGRLSMRLSRDAIRRRRLLAAPVGPAFPWLLALKASCLSVSALAGVYLVLVPLVTGLIPVIY